METVLQLSAPMWGFFLGTLLFARVGRWIQSISTASGDPLDPASCRTRAVAAATLLHSGPWLLVAMAYWAYQVLAQPHAPAWDWFFSGVVAAIPVWAIVTLHYYRRGKRIEAKRAKADNAV